MKNKIDTKTRVQLIMAVVIVAFGCGLILSGLIIPPSGEIHPSVLTAFGEILTFAGAIIGIDYNYKIKRLKHGDNSEENV